MKRDCEQEQQRQSSVFQDSYNFTLNFKVWGNALQTFRSTNGITDLCNSKKKFNLSLDNMPSMMISFS